MKRLIANWLYKKSWEYYLASQDYFIHYPAGSLGSQYGVLYLNMSELYWSLYKAFLNK